MGFVTMGTFAANQQGIEGAIIQMLSHGVVSAALFLIVGVVYDRLHTREIKAYGGVSDVMPKFAFFFMIMMLASVGLPGTSGFVGELLVLIGIWKINIYFAILTATGLILGATYMLWLYRRVMFGTIVNVEVQSLKMLNAREIIIFVPLTFFIIFLGLYANPLLKMMDQSVNNIVQIAKTSNNIDINTQIVELKKF